MRQFQAEGSRKTGSCRFDNPYEPGDASKTYKHRVRIVQKPPKVKRVGKVDDRLLAGLLRSPGKIELTLGLVTVSEANCFEPWQKKSDRHKDQHKQIALHMLQCQNDIKLPCTITFIRYGIKPLDKHDNLPISNKYLADKIAEILTGKTKGKGDCDERLTWKYDQVKSTAKGVKIVFEF